MKSDVLLDAFGLISDEYVQDAKAVQSSRKSGNVKKYSWLGWGVMAACACLLVSVTIGSGIFTSSDSTANSVNSGGSSAMSDAVSEDGLETESANQSAYPYSDIKVLEYVGAELKDMETQAGVIVFHEITDMDMYRAFNNQEESMGETYYKTHDAVYYNTVAGQENVEYFRLTEENGEISVPPDSDISYEAVTEVAPEMVVLAEYYLNHDSMGGSLEGAAVYEQDAVVIKVQPAEGSNGQVTVLGGRDLCALGEEMQAFVSPMQELLETGQGCEVAGQEVAVQYFYQQRMFREQALEECYNYYAYFEKEDMQYLYQYSSNWTLVGEEVTAIHNPPYTESYAMSQERSRELFAELLSGSITCME